MDKITLKQNSLIESVMTIFNTNSILRFVSLLIMFGLVLPLASLPAAWQHQTIVIYISLFILLEFAVRKFARQYMHLLRYGMIWSLYIAIMLLVLSTGGLSSEYFFLTYVLVLASSFTLPLGAELIVMFWINSILLWDHLVAASPFTLFALQSTDMLKLATLIGFSPFVVFLADRYSHSELEHEHLDEATHLLHTFAREDAALLESISAGVILLDNSLEVLRFSTSAEQLTGLKAADVLQTRLFDHIDLNMAGTHHSFESRLTDSIISYKDSVEDILCDLFGKNGKKNQISLNAHPVVDDSEEVLGVMLIFEDSRIGEIMREHNQGRL